MDNTKKLYIVRHGKSSWDYDVEDLDRPLKERGINDAHTMAERMNERQEHPHLIISSHANRALHTSMIFSRRFNHPSSNIRISNIIYEGNDSQILNFIKKIDGSIASIMVFGHNPMSTDLANMFLKEKLDKLPTAGIAFLEFDTDSWANIDADNVVSEWVDYPKKES